MNNYNETVLELLKNYVDDEINLIFEYSGDFTKSLKILEKRTLKYVKNLNISYDDSYPILSKIKENIRNCNGS